MARRLVLCGHLKDGNSLELDSQAQFQLYLLKSESWGYNAEFKNRALFPKESRSHSQVGAVRINLE